MVDVAAVPDGLENSISKAESQNILDGLLTQVVIDSIDLLLFGEFQQLLVQRFRRLQIAPEWFFDDNPAPVMILFPHQSSFRQILYDGTKVVWRSRQVEEIVAVCGVIFVHLLQYFLQLRVDILVVEIP